MARLWVLGGVLTVAALLLATWFLGVSPRLSEAATANSTREGVESQNDLHALKVAALAAQFEKIDELRGELSAAQVAIPAGYTEPELLEQLQEYAAATGVTIMDFTLEAPQVFSAPNAAVLDDPELTAAASAASGGSFVVIPITIAVSGGVDGLLAFTAQVQAGGRYALVHQLALDNDLESGDQPGLQIAAQIFALVDGPAILGEALPAEIPATPEPATQG